jgi:MFS family permease
VLFAVAPVSGKLTGRIALRIPLVAGLLLIAVALLLMRGLSVTSEWTRLLPGLVVGGLAIGVISPALAAAMVGVLSADRVGLASGINNTFRQLGIAVGIAALGAVFADRVDGSPGLAGLVDGLNAVFGLAALVALAGAAAAWPLLGGLRVTQPTSWTASSSSNGARRRV